MTVRSIIVFFSLGMMAEVKEEKKKPQLVYANEIERIYHHRHDNETVVMIDSSPWARILENMDIVVVNPRRVSNGIFRRWLRATCESVGIRSVAELRKETLVDGVGRRNDSLWAAIDVSRNKVSVLRLPEPGSKDPVRLPNFDFGVLRAEPTAVLIMEAEEDCGWIKDRIEALFV